MTEKTEIVEQRQTAAQIVRESREKIVRRWMRKMRLLTREKGPEGFAPEPVIRQDAREYVDLLLSHLESKAPEGDLVAFYRLIMDGRQYNVRLADIAYMLLELKSVSKQIVFEEVGDELGAFRVSRLVDDAIEGVLRRSADLYELTGEADQKTAQERLQEIFAAWELEKVLGEAQMPAEVCRLATEKLGEMWNLLGCRLRIYEWPNREVRDIVEGPELPVPVVKEQRQYLTAQELQAGGAISLLERVRRRRETLIGEDVRTDRLVMDATQLRKAGISSFACCPLVCRDRVEGVLLLYGAEPDTFRQADRRRLDDLASVLALAVDRTVRLERSHKEMSEAEVIARIGRALLELPTREALLQGVAEALRAFRDYFDVSLFRVDEETAECRLVAEAGRERRYRPDEYRQKISEGFIGLCAQSAQTIRASDLADDTRRLVAFQEEYRARSELAVPVKKGDRVLGVMHFLSEREDDFPDSEVAALEHVAPHIGVALLNAHMIVERRHQRYTIEQAHRELANIVRSTAVGITSTDTKGVYTHWSPSCEAMFGYQAGEVVGRKSPVDFAAEPYDLREALDQCLREGQASAERTMVPKDGTRRIIRETRVPLKDENGQHIGFTAYLVDVTEQKRAEERLRRERDTLNVVVDATGAGLALFDRQLRLQWANSTLMKWFNFGPEAFGRQCHQVYMCGRSSGDTCPVIIAATAGEPQTHEHEFTDESGAWHCYQQVFTPVEHFGETRLVVLTLDVTEQRRQTEQMRLINKLTERVATSLNLERVLHLVLSCVTAGHAIGLNRAFIFLLDEQGGALEGEMAVGPVSSADARRIWEDLEQKEQTIEQLLDSAVPSESDRRLSAVVRSLRVPVSNEQDTLVSTLNSRTSAHVGDARSDPDIFPELIYRLGLEEFVCVPLAVQNEPLGVMLADNKFSKAPIDQDQVELLEMFSRQASLAIANARAYEKIRAQLEELQRTRDRLIEAERMASVGRMASHLAHEIRNPLAAIGGFASFIARKASDDFETRRNAMIIYEETRRLERTLANALDYTRPLRPNKVPICVNEIVQETIEQFKAELQENSITSKMSLAEQMPEALADQEMIKQVIINLVKNAIEAMGDRQGGILSVATAREEDEVIIVVADTGGGMDQGTLDELFSPFYTTKVGGIGLGLSISQRIVAQHGGRITAETELGVGSRFVVSLAVHDADGDDDGEELEIGERK